jgi:restriction endonuclease S subunit
VKLENLMNIGRGASPRPIDDYLTTDSNGINWIKIGDVEVGAKYITKTEEKITKEGAGKSRKVSKGDFILSNSMSFGRPYILKIDGCIHDGWLLLSNIDNKLNQDYLYNILSYDDTQRQFSESALGGVVRNLNTDRVKSTIIPLPPEDIQTKIVAECEAIDQEASNAENEIARIKNEISNIFINGEFVTKNLNQIIHKQSEQIDPNQATGDVFYVGLENIESNTGNLVGNPLTQYATIKSNKNIFKKGDLLYGKLRPNLNKLYLANEEGICSTDILVFRCLDEELNKFYAYYLRTKQFNDEVLKTVSGQQLPRTKWSLIETIKVPVPQANDKQNIIQKIEKLEEAIQREQAKINSAADQKKAVMKKYLE